MKYQIGGGLSIDAHLGPLWAALYGAADDLLDPARVDATLRAILRHNFKPSMREAANTWRVFAADDEAGTVMVSWPKGRRKPVIPIPYHSECMTGFEWAFATHLAWRGRVREAEKVAAAVRARYDGAKRNPWNEIECGSNYVRAMAAYGLVQAFSGFRYDMTRGEIGFAPRIAGAFSSFWSVGRAWGVYSRTAAGRERIEVLFGSLPLRRLALSNTSPLPSQSDNIPRICVSVISPHPTVSGIILHPSVSSTSPRPSVSERSLRLASRTVSARREADTLVFSRSLLLRAGDILQLRPF